MMALYAVVYATTLCRPRHFREHVSNARRCGIFVTSPIKLHRPTATVLASTNAIRHDSLRNGGIQDGMV